MTTHYRLGDTTAMQTLRWQRQFVLVSRAFHYVLLAVRSVTEKRMSDRLAEYGMSPHSLFYSSITSFRPRILLSMHGRK